MLEQRLGQARAPLWLPAIALMAGLAAFAPEVAQAQGQVEESNVADEADVQFQLGNDAYRSSNFVTALSHYFASNRLARNQNVLFNIARCYEQLKRYVEAYRYYQIFSQAETLDKDERKAVTDALKRVKRYVALIDVRSEPPGATIYLNRRDLGGYGTTPSVLAVAPDTYTVILDRPGYVAYEQPEVKIKVGQQTEVSGKLERILGGLTVSGQPEGAQIRVVDASGPVVGVLPSTMQLSPGKHRMEVSFDGYVPREIPIEIEAGKTGQVEVELERQTGTIVVQSDEPDALILVDGRPAGFTPSVVDNLSAGTHEVVVQQNGFLPYAQTVEVEVDDRVLVQAVLVVSEEVEAASKSAQSLVNAPASVSLISQREIRAFGFTNVSDALTGTRGYYNSNDLTYLSPGLRGYSPFGQYGNRVLVQQDGHTLNDDWIGSSYIGFDLTSHIDELQQIEVVRGPVSVLYGTGAFFGVINLVTPDTPPPDTQLRVGLGTVEEGAARARVSVAAPLGGGDAAWLSAGGILTQGQPYFSAAYVGSDEAPDGRLEDAGGFDSASARGKLKLGDFTLHGAFNQRDKRIPTGSFETIFGDPRTNTLDRRGYAEVKYDKPLGESFTLGSRVYYDHYSYEGNFPYPVGDSGLNTETYSGHWVGAEVLGTLALTEGMAWTIGTEGQRHIVSSGEGGSVEEATPYLDEDTPFTQFSIYTLYAHRLAPWFAISAALRFDGWLISDLPQPDGTKEDQFTSSLNPRLALIFNPTETTTLKLMGGRAFRAPSIYELTYNDGGITQVPSPAITPETILTGEVELSQRFAENYLATASVYYNRIDDLIEQNGEGDETSPLIFVNQPEPLQTIGSEVEVRREFRLGWMMALQYSFQHTRLVSLSDGSRPPNSPAHLAGARLVVPLYARALKLATRVSFDGGRLDRVGDETDEAILWDLALSGEANLLDLRYSAGVRNMLGWRHEHPVGEDVLDVTLPQPGRTFVADVSVAF